MTLDELALKYGTDKSSKLHHYTRHYEKHFESLRHEPIIFLEIGVQQGLSLLMWRDYFDNTDAEIRGIDIDLSHYSTIDTPRIFTHLADQGKPEDLKRVIEYSGPPDIVLDDGSHHWRDQITSFITLWPHVKSGGWYVIEDLHTSYIPAYGRDEVVSCMDFLQKLTDELNCHGQCSGLGSMENEKRFNPHLNLTGYQKSVESITFYKSIVFIQKRKWCL